MPDRGSRAGAPVVVAVLVMVVWGATPVMTRLALDDLEPLVVATLRTVVAGLLAVPLLAQARLPFPRAGQTRRLLAISGRRASSCSPSCTRSASSAPPASTA